MSNDKISISDLYKEIINLANNLFFQLLDEYSITYKSPFLISNLDINNYKGKYEKFEILGYLDEKKVFLKLKSTELKNENIINNAIIDVLTIKIKRSRYIVELYDFLKSKDLEYFKIRIDNEIVTKIDEIVKDFKLINKLSQIKYEGAICKGVLCIDNPDKVTSILEFQNAENKTIKFNENNVNIIRKLLETTNDNIALLIDKNEKENYYYVSKMIEYNKNLSYVKFTGKSRWNYEVNGNILLTCDHNKFSQNNDFVLSNSFQNNIKKFFESFDKNSSQEKLDCVTKYISQIKSLGDHFHGALIVFTDNAKYSRDMCNYMRGIEISNTINLFEIMKQGNDNVTKKLLKQLNCIDGAILFDQSGNLLSFGIILDGCVQSPGDRSRGSRYNSAKTFTEHYGQIRDNKNYLSIVLSEDGPIDVFCSVD